MQNKVISPEKSLPEGMRFYLPEQAEIISSLAGRGMKLLEGWGYRPVYVPALIPYSTIAAGLGEEQTKNFYKLVDYRGEILVLRPEMTAAIAHRLSDEQDDEDVLGRYQYFAPVYRHETTQSGKKREIYQLGAEFLGDSDYADIEILILAQDVISACAGESFEVDIGHTGFLNKLLDEVDISSPEAEKLKSMLACRDLVGFRSSCRQFAPEASERLLKIPELRGKEEVLDKAEALLSSSDCRPMRQLRKIETGLRRADRYENVYFDLSLVRNLDYYSGMVFEIISPELGYSICGGGRYDRLLDKLGRPQVSGRGFAVGLERLRLIRRSRDDNGSRRSPRAVICFDEMNSFQEALEVSRLLQEKGYQTIMSPGRDSDQLKKDNSSGE